MIPYDQMKGFIFAKGTIKDGYNGHTMDVQFCYFQKRVFCLAPFGYHRFDLGDYDTDKEAFEAIENNPRVIEVTCVPFIVKFRHDFTDDSPWFECTRCDLIACAIFVHTSQPDEYTVHVEGIDVTLQVKIYARHLKEAGDEICKLKIDQSVSYSRRKLS